MRQILVMDDSGAIRKAIRRILEQLDYGVSEAEDGVIALAALKSTARFDAMLCDIDMPNMDGLTFLGAVASEHIPNPPPIVMCTTHSRFDKIEKALTLGASEYIIKPLDAEIISSKLAACGVA